MTKDEEIAIRAQLTTYYAEHISHNSIAMLAEIVLTAFLIISEKPGFTESKYTSMKLELV